MYNGQNAVNLKVSLYITFSLWSSDCVTTETNIHFVTRIGLRACGSLLAGPESGHAAAMVTGWTSPQHGQIWHPGVWWDPSPSRLKLWHTEYSRPLFSGWRNTHTHRVSTSLHKNSTSQLTYALTRQQGWRNADWSWCSSTLCLVAPASYWTLCSISLVQNHADLWTHAQMNCTLFPFFFLCYFPVCPVWDVWYCGFQWTDCKIK